MLELQATITLAADNTIATIQDSTGDYDAINNPGGFGAPNPLRNEIGLFIVGKKTTGAGVESFLNRVEDYDPLTEDSFAFELSGDGWYTLFLVGLQLFDGLASYSSGDYVYNSGTGNIEQYNGATWDIVADPNDIDLTHSTVFIYEENVVDAINLENRFLALNSDFLLNLEYFDDVSRKLLHNTTSAYYHGIILLGEKGAYQTAAKDLERISTILTAKGY